MDRPIVYAVGVIVASFLPIYVLSGPSGRLFEPMADTTIFALDRRADRDADGHSRAVRDPAASRHDRAREQAVPLAAAALRARTRLGHGAAAPRRRRVLRAVRSWPSPASALIGAEFMPKLDEGSLWVRATMPYTISFDESSRIVPQIRTVLRSFPEVTIVSSEHGRPDDGTNPTGFFNAEFFVGLRPYGEWTRFHRSKAELIAAIDKKLSAFPGDQLQLHAAGRGCGGRGGDRAQELTRREAVRLGPHRARGARPRDQARARRRPRHHARHARRGARPAEPHDRGRPQPHRAVRHQRRRREWPHRGRRRRERRHAGRAGRAHLRSRRAAQAGVPPDARADRQHPRRHAVGRAGPAARAGDDRRQQRRVVHLSPGQLALHRRAVRRRRARPRERRRGRAAAGREAA